MIVNSAQMGSPQFKAEGFLIWSFFVGHTKCK